MKNIIRNYVKRKKRGKKEKKRNTEIQDYLTLVELSFPVKCTFFLKLFQNENSRYSNRLVFHTKKIPPQRAKLQNSF